MYVYVFTYHNIVFIRVHALQYRSYLCSRITMLCLCSRIAITYLFVFRHRNIVPIYLCARIAITYLFMFRYRNIVFICATYRNIVFIVFTHRHIVFALTYRSIVLICVHVPQYRNDLCSPIEMVPNYFTYRNRSLLLP